ncbi:bZIP transcription factor TGA10-like isoform X3 [Senna tora]|uniref:BZIP transcription factor TGA10-like isoform X3 n=1 Tax=Senna tora TaxID=362788 RepID=A0A834WSX0_9FABA|nr:bZIP transcription factor TGA10-like isoform X3 [Senna tora]
MFDVEYGRWEEEHHRLVCKLRATVQENLRLRKNELGLFVDNCLAHYDQIMNFNSIVSKTSSTYIYRYN